MLAVFFRSSCRVSYTNFIIFTLYFRSTSASLSISCCIPRTFNYLLGSPQNSLYFFRFQNTSQISICHLGHWKIVILLPAWLLTPGAIQGVQFTESWKEYNIVCQTHYSHRFLRAKALKETTHRHLACLHFSYFKDCLSNMSARENEGSSPDSVQMQNLPTCPPGASFNRLSFSTQMVSTPGMLRKARVRPWSLL